MSNKTFSTRLVCYFDDQIRSKVSVLAMVG